MKAVLIDIKGKLPDDDNSTLGRCKAPPDLDLLLLTLLQLLACILGGPGTGKSFLSICISDYLDRELQVAVMQSATTGVAASLLWRNDHSLSSSHSCHQPTCEHTFARNPARICKPQDWSDIDRRDLDAYIIDVDLCSRSAPARILENNRPFGGMSLLLVGDFFQ